MSEILPAESYLQLLSEGTPLIDVRAPVEFARGSFPAAVNLPLLDDSEREAVGKRYRQAGQDAAIELGQQLVSGSVRQQRIAQWLDFIDAHPDAVIYCFRGGLRSRTAQQWLAEAGYPRPRVAGGYKAMRRFLTDTIDQASRRELLIVGGKTGCAKTDLVNRLPAGIDLEGLANHRGSAFGRRVDPQPTQIDFENRLAIRLLQLPFTGYQRLLLEDEGHAIGSLSVPLGLFRQMRQAPLAIVEESLSYRVQTVLHAYVEVNYRDFSTANPDTVAAAFSDYLLSSLQRIQRRLGSDLFREIHAELEEALNQHLRHGDIEAHRAWIEKLLRLYYDPMYDFQLSKKLQRLVFRGNSAEFLHWAEQLQWHAQARAGRNAAPN
ncbi:MAG: tRNA 2-selenouridine(34) synthase MnmH [Gammaproteobacteria bacterium]|nr:tRNA 2-selenouridine(34) synthase MnmH [Pseudomonadales bacterium]MCP5346089.1 tRNA 2-selenouridine(34) synthase MnmH [Pseudomonadales bacterium]